MTSLDHYLDEQLSRSQAYFSREEALAALGLSSAVFIAAASRLAKKQRLVSPRRGFYLILRPEDRVARLLKHRHILTNAHVLIKCMYDKGHKTAASDQPGSEAVDR